MQIAEVRTYVLKIPNDAPYLGALPDGSMPASGYQVRPPWRSLYSPLFETTLVRLTAEDGTVGWGEALAPVAPEVPAAIIDLLFADRLVGADARSPRPISRGLAQLMRERGHLGGHQADALAAVDIALWDLAGRLAGVSVAELLGGAFRTDIPTYISGLPRSTDADRAALAGEWQERGATAVKLHLGYGVEADLATVDSIRDAAPALRVAVDAHWAYSVQEARTLAEGLAQRGGWFLEAPLAPEDMPGHADLRTAPIPIAVGETLRHRYEFASWIEQRLMGIAQPDIGRTGITEAINAAELCSAHHMPMAPHHSVALGVALAAGLHVSAVTEDLLAFEYQPTTIDVAQRVLSQPIDIQPSHIALPEGPGLGIELDTDIVESLNVKENQR